MSTLKPDWEDPVIKRACDYGREYLTRFIRDMGQDRDPAHVFQTHNMDIVTYLYSDDSEIADIFKDVDEDTIAAEKRIISILLLTQSAQYYFESEDKEYERLFGKEATDVMIEMISFDPSADNNDQSLYTKYALVEQAFATKLYGDTFDEIEDSDLEKILEKPRRMYEEWIKNKNDLANLLNDPDIQRAANAGRLSLSQSHKTNMDNQYQRCFMDAVTFLYSDDPIIAEAFKDADPVTIAADKKTLALLFLTIPAWKNHSPDEYELQFGPSAKDVFLEVDAVNTLPDDLSGFSPLVQKFLMIYRGFLTQAFSNTASQSETLIDGIERNLAEIKQSNRDRDARLTRLEQAGDSFPRAPFIRAAEPVIERPKTAEKMTEVLESLDEKAPGLRPN